MSKSGIDNQCRLCGSKNYRTLLKGIKTAYDEEYALVQCACGFISISPMPDEKTLKKYYDCLLYTSPSPRDRTRSRMPSSA